MLRSPIFPWSPADFSLELSSANLRAIHSCDEEVRAASTLCEFDMSPMEKKQEKLHLWSIGLMENKKEHSSDGSEDSKTKKNVRPTAQMEAK